jgi:uncharacterized membrane protein YheB (UPF0754 family)
MVFFATAHGYAGAWLAVRMLFRPRRPVKLLGLTVFPQGMIPRHRERLANAIGRAVGNELVSQDTVVHALFEKDFFRQKIAALVNSYADDLLQRDLPPLPQLLPLGAQEGLEAALAGLLNRIESYIVQSLKNEETAAAIEKFVGNRLDEALSQRVSQIIDDNTFTEIQGFLDKRLRGIMTEKALEAKVREFVSQRVDDLANTATPLGDMFTPEAVEFVKERLRDQTQPFVHHIAEMATQERTRNQIGALVKREINDYYQELPFFQRIFVSRDKLYREVDDLVNKTLPARVDEFLKGESFAEEAEIFLNNSVDNVLARPLPELTGQIAPEKLDALKTQVSNGLLALVQGEEMQRSVSAYLGDTMHRLRPHSLKAIIERLNPEAASRLRHQLAKGLLQLLQREETGKIVNSVLAAQIERLMSHPIGKLSDHFSEQTVRSAADLVTDQIVAAAREKLPAAIADFDIGGIVREKVNNYPVEKLEDLVLSVAREHLRTIEIFGAIFGFVIGLSQAVFAYFALAK